MVSLTLQGMGSEAFQKRDRAPVKTPNTNILGQNKLVGLLTVSRILHHIHRCLIYEAIMRHFRDKYEAIMKQISIFYSKNEVLGAAIFVHCQTTLKL